MEWLEANWFWIGSIVLALLTGPVEAWLARRPESAKKKAAEEALGMLVETIQEARQEPQLSGGTAGGNWIRRKAEERMAGLTPKAQLALKVGVAIAKGRVPPLAAAGLVGKWIRNRRKRRSDG